MATGTRSAPTVDGTGTYVRLTIRVIDAGGDVRSDSIRMPDGVTNAEVEDYVAKYQLVSQASVFEVHINEIYASQPDTSNAVNTPRESADDVINALFHDDTAVSQDAVLRAPSEVVFVAGSETPDKTDAGLINWYTAGALLLNGGAAGAGTYSAISIRFSEHREINQRVRI